MNKRGKKGGGLLASDRKAAEKSDFLTLAYNNTTQFEKGQVPVALQIKKRGRWCTVAKVTRFVGGHSFILAVAWRSQIGTREAISLPSVVLDYAQRLGVRWFYLRDDRKRKMLACPLATFWRGRLHPDGEFYVPLTWLEEVPLVDWIYAERVVRLQQPNSAVQPTLLEVA